MPAVLTPIPYNGVSPIVLTELLAEIGDYSVALARISGDQTKTFHLLGSATCVRRGSEYGLLTAHHVLHAHRPPVVLGENGTDRIFFFVRRNETVEFKPIELKEQPLGWPAGEYRQFGPDLTFVRILSESARASLAAKCSFWPLNDGPEKVADTFGVDRAVMIHTGYAASRCAVTVENTNIHARLTLFGGIGGLLQGDILLQDGWDYLDTVADYRAFPQLPESFGGMSGGGIWSALFQRDDAGQLRAYRFALVGVNFWQSAPENGTRRIRGHFIDSIYRRAWEPRT